MRSTDKVIGRRIAELRDREGLNQAEFAERLGLEQAAISRYETGRVAVPLSRVVQIAQALRLNIQELVQVPSDDADRDRALDRLLLMVTHYSPEEIELVMDVGAAAVNHVRKIRTR